MVVAMRRRWDAARRRSLVEAGRRFGGWGRKRVMEGRREEGGEEGEGCGGHGGRRFWVSRRDGCSVMGWGVVEGEGWEGKKWKRIREGRGWFGEGGAVAGRSVARRCGVAGRWWWLQRGRESAEGKGEMLTRGARVSRGLG
nr:uncharacterized protein LOC112757253 [Arachis hypogaea]